MKKHVKPLFKHASLFIIGAVIYMVVELLWRGYTHWTMGILGGICFIVIGSINELFSWDLLFWIQCACGSIVITALEFIAGYILNIHFDLAIWDYSDIPFNVMGQICPQYTLAWFALSAVAIILDDYLRWTIFGEEKPRYIFFQSNQN